MAENSGPWDGSPGTFGEDQWSALFSSMLPNGVFGRPTSLDLLPYADAGGMRVKVRIGQGFVNGQWYQLTTEKTITIDNGDSQPRIDVVVLHRDSVANTVTATLIKGTPGAIPAAPSLTAQDTALAHVNVAANRTSNIAPGECVDWRQFMPARLRPALPGINLSPGPDDDLIGRVGDIVIADGFGWFWSDDGGAWAQFQTVQDTGWQLCTMAAGWTSSGPALQARTLNGVTFIRGYNHKTAAGAARTEYIIGTLPVNSRPSAIHRWAQVNGTPDIMDCYAEPDGTIRVLTGTLAYAAGIGLPINTSFANG